MSETTARSAETRKALLNQLAHLIDEMDALGLQLDLIPPEVLTGRPVETAPSFKEIYGHLARYDEAVLGQAVRRIEENGKAVVTALSSYEPVQGRLWNEWDTVALLDEVQSNRAALIAGLKQLSLEQWTRPVTIDGERTDVFGLAYHIIQHDAALLRAAAYRLHESRLGEPRRPAGPPDGNRPS